MKYTVCTRLDEATSLIKLYQRIHPESKTAQADVCGGSNLTLIRVSKNNNKAFLWQLMIYEEAVFKTLDHRIVFEF